MPIKCCVQGCKSRYGEVKLSFHRFPAPCTVRDALRRQLWVKATAINSRNVNRRFVCGRHFVTGKPAAFSAVNEPDWIPTLFLYECSEDVSTNETAPEIEDSSLIQVVDRRLSLKRKSLAGSLHGNNTKRYAANVTIDKNQDVKTEPTSSGEYTTVDALPSEQSTSIPAYGHSSNVPDRSVQKKPCPERETIGQLRQSLSDSRKEIEFLKHVVAKQNEVIAGLRNDLKVLHNIK